MKQDIDILFYKMGYGMQCYDRILGDKHSDVWVQVDSCIIND